VKAKPWRVIAAGCIVLAGVVFIVGLYAIGLTQKSAAQRDYIEYWAAGQELVHGANPYDPKAILDLERSVGWDKDFPQITLSPPMILLLAWPLGYMSPKTGLILWLLASLGCMVASAWIVWLLHGKPESRMHLVGLAFPPALACLMAAQLGDFFLLETALFLYLHRSRPWLAGAVLVLFALKPHLFVPCFLVLLLWSVVRRDFKVLAGFLIAVVSSCAIVTLLDPQSWHQYRQMMLSTKITDAFVPTLAVGLRFMVDRQSNWLEFLPEIIACIWASWYFWSRRERWNWSDQGLLLLLVSTACSSYGWYYDQALLFPAIAAGLYRAERSRISMLSFMFIAAGGLIAIFGQIQPTSGFYVWTAPAWLLWYIYATRERRSPSALASEMVAPAG
jgi:hypothetical protein